MLKIALLLLISANAFALNPSGVQFIREAPQAGYEAYASFTPAATPTDVCTFAGSSQKYTRIHKIRLTMGQATSGLYNVQIVKRSSNDKSGTQAQMTSVPLDSGYVPGGASVYMWTANPSTLGTQVGILRGASILASQNSATTPGNYEFDFGPLGNRLLVLRSANEQVAVSLQGAAIGAGLSVGCGFLWTEEPAP